MSQTQLRASEPFHFYTSHALQVSTGLRAVTLTELAKLLRTVSESSVYHHTHHFLLQHHYLTPEPPNDFAYWVGEVLGEEELAELLTGIDTLDYLSLEELRDVITRTIERYIKLHPTSRFKFTSEGQEFFFIESKHIVTPTDKMVYTLEEFRDALKDVSVKSLYFHMFGARLRLKEPTSDFARWVGLQLGMKEFAKEMSSLDPYAHTLEALRTILINMISEHIGKK